MVIFVYSTRVSRGVDGGLMGVAFDADSYTSEPKSKRERPQRGAIKV